MGGNVQMVGFRRHGYACTISTHPMGFLVGEVAIPEGHPWHGNECEWELSPLAEWSGSDSRGGPWRVGFDCGHHNQADDRKSADYVRRTLESLAYDARIAATTEPPQAEDGPPAASVTRNMARELLRLREESGDESAWSVLSLMAEGGLCHETALANAGYTVGDDGAEAPDDATWFQCVASDGEDCVASSQVFDAVGIDARSEGAETAIVLTVADARRFAAQVLANASGAERASEGDL